eukprot:scaffold586_cov155-Amphora_coffeaeformis.AAC.3
MGGKRVAVSCRLFPEKLKKRSSPSDAARNTNWEGHPTTQQQKQRHGIHHGGKFHLIRPTFEKLSIGTI